MPAEAVNANVSTPAKKMLKEWESNQLLYPAWHAPYKHKPELVVLEVRSKKPQTPESADQAHDVARGPLHCILVERRLKFSTAANGDIERASIELRYARIGGWEGDSHSEASGSMSAGYSRHLNRISLAKAEVNGTTGAVFLTMQGGIPKGMRIGAYLMDEIVTWAKHWPDADVQPIALVKGQAVDENDRAIRNKFWRKFGLELHFDDAEERDGRSLPMKARDLTNSSTWSENITVVPLVEFAGKLQQSMTLAQRHSANLSAKVAGHEVELEKQRRHPFIWAWRVAYRTWVQPYHQQALALAVILVLAFGVARSLGWKPSF